MRDYTDKRTARSADEIWLVEHPPVYTLGQAGRREHVHDSGPVPVVAADRGGQVTYHGPGQLVAYVLLDLPRLGLAVRELVHSLEQAVIDVVTEAGLKAGRRRGAPGVYLDGRKLAALGLRVRRGRSYHGIAVNVDLDLTPFRGIDPCGFPDLEVTRLRDHGLDWTVEETGRRLSRSIVAGIAAAAPRARARVGRSGWRPAAPPEERGRGAVAFAPRPGWPSGG